MDVQRNIWVLYIPDTNQIGAVASNAREVNRLTNIIWDRLKTNVVVYRYNMANPNVVISGCRSKSGDRYKSGSQECDRMSPSGWKKSIRLNTSKTNDMFFIEPATAEDKLSSVYGVGEMHRDGTISLVEINPDEKSARFKAIFMSKLNPNTTTVCFRLPVNIPICGVELSSFVIATFKNNQRITDVNGFEDDEDFDEALNQFDDGEDDNDLDNGTGF